MSEQTSLTRAIGAVIAGTLISLIGTEIERSVLYLQLRDAQENHASFEGTWTPHQVRLSQVEKKMAAFDQAEQNHAMVEGADTPRARVPGGASA